MAVEEIIPPLTQAGILYVTEFNTPLTADSKRTLREVLDDPAIPGILVRELAQEESHLFSVQGPATRILGRYRVYDTGTRKLSYYAWAGSILKRALTRVPDEQYIGVVHKGPNWGDQKALRRLGGKV